MKALLPGAVFIGFTGTPLLKTDKQKSIEVFGRYIHTYKFDEAVKDGVVVDLRYEARDIDQDITSQAKIDQWFGAKTKGLTDLAKAQPGRIIASIASIQRAGDEAAHWASIGSVGLRGQSAPTAIYEPVSVEQRVL